MAWEDVDQRVHVDYVDVTETLHSAYGVDPWTLAPPMHVPALLLAVDQE